MLLDAFLSSMVPRKLCSFINLRNYLVVEAQGKSLLCCLFFPNTFLCKQIGENVRLLPFRLGVVCSRIRNQKYKDCFSKTEKNLIAAESRKSQ